MPSRGSQGSSLTRYTPMCQLSASSGVFRLALELWTPSANCHHCVWQVERQPAAPVISPATCGQVSGRGRFIPLDVEWVALCSMGPEHLNWGRQTTILWTKRCEDLQTVLVVVCAQLHLTLCHPMNCIAPQAPLEFSRQEYWSGLLFPPPGDLSNSGIGPVSLASLAMAGGCFTTAPPGTNEGKRVRGTTGSALAGVTRWKGLCWRMRDEEWLAFSEGTCLLQPLRLLRSRQS